MAETIRLDDPIDEAELAWLSIILTCIVGVVLGIKFLIDAWKKPSMLLGILPRMYIW